MNNGVYKTKLFTLVMSIIIILFFSVGIAFAWFSNSRIISDIGFDSGKFDTNLQIQYFDKDLEAENKWVNVPTSGVNGSFYPHFGQMSDMSKPPENDVYLKIKVLDETLVRYIYDITITSIEIKVYRILSNSYSLVEIEAINYYSDTIFQNCIDLSFIISPNENLQPSQIDFGIKTHITAEDCSITNDVFIEDRKWLYVKLMLRKDELLNIIRLIPLEYMPNKIEFLFNLESQTRTMDNE